MIHRKITTFAFIFLAWGLLVGLVYHDTPSNFLRAESGWYLFLSHSDPAVRHDFEKMLLTKSSNGHYAPLAFLAEFETAKLVGSRAAFWKWRQISVLTAMASLLFLIARTGGRVLGLPQWNAGFAGMAVTSLFIFQPWMREFVAWPFTIMQLLWLLLSLLALASLVQMSRRPREARWPWAAAGCAYASLHVFGLGLATIAATAMVLTGFWFCDRRQPSPGVAPTFRPLLVLGFLTLLHGLLMFTLLSSTQGTETTACQPLPFIKTALGFISNFALATLRNSLSTNQQLSGNAPVHLIRDWLYGVSILLGFGLIVAAGLYRCLQENAPPQRLKFVFRTFAVVSFLSLIALVSARQWYEPSAHGFADFLVGSRYLIPASFTLIGLLAELFFALSIAPRLLSACLLTGITACALLGNLHFTAHVYPVVVRQSATSHERAWRAVVAMARECIQEGLPIPNVPLGQLTQEFYDWDLKLFEPLLRADLHVSREHDLQFVSWQEFLNGSRDGYAPVLSLPKVQRELRLRIDR